MPQEPLKLYDYQERIISSSQEIFQADSSLLIAAPTGAGKCHPPGTRVLLHTGDALAVEHIRPGHLLMGPDSLPRLVLSTSTGFGPLAEIRPHQGEPWRCNHCHVLTLSRPSPEPPGPGDPMRPTLADIPLDTFRQTLSPEEQAAHHLVRPPGVLFPNTAPADLDHHQYGAQLAQQDPQAPAQVPHPILTAPPAGRLQLLAGLLDQAGAPAHDGYTITLHSGQLARDTLFLARSLGFQAQHSPTGPGPQPGPGQPGPRTLTIRGHTRAIPCRNHPRPTQGATLPTRQSLSTPFTVADLPPGPYHGFTLSGDGRYLLEDYTITHNTVILAEMMARCQRREMRSALLVHRQELVEQSEEKIIRQAGTRPGVIWQSRREWDQPMTIMAQDTISALDLPDLPPLDLLVVDEAHHTVAPGWLRTIQRLNPRYLLGFSATPFRQDREPLSPEPFAQVIRPVTPQELMDLGVLCPAVIESPIILDAQGMPQPLSRASNIDHIYYQAVQYAIAQHRTKILLYVSQTQEYTPSQVIRRIQRRLRSAGITAEAVSQEVSSRQRRAAISRFTATAAASVLINYMALTEGTDIPLVDCVIIGRHTQSESTLIQMIGRGLRDHPAKQDCLVLNYTTRADMKDIIHYWRLDSPQEPGANTQQEIVRDLTRPQLAELAVNFPRTLSVMDSETIRYPWFRPFDRRPLMALPVWSGPGTQPRYVTVEPRSDGVWKVTNVILQNAGPAPIYRQQSLANSQEQAIAMVRQALGQHAPHMERAASWRLQPASPAQQQTWLSLHPASQAHEAQALTAGEASDAIAQERFQRRVNPRLL